MTTRYVCRIVREDDTIASDEIVGCWRDPDKARAWADRFEKRHEHCTVLVQELQDPTFAVAQMDDAL